MNLDQLVSLIVSYAKRPDLETEIRSYFLPLAESRIGRDLRAFENEAQADVVFTGGNVADLPADYGNIRAVYPPGGVGRALANVDIITLANRRVQAGEPGFYNIRGKGGEDPPELSEIEVRPYGDGTTLPIFYFTRPSLAAGSGQASNAISIRWPQVYLYAALVELHIWEKNQEALTFVRGIYGQDVAQINRDAERARGSKPAMRLG